MVDVGRREDRLLDFISTMRRQIDLALLEVGLFRESSLTAHEMEILNAIEKHLTKKEDG